MTGRMWAALVVVYVVWGSTYLAIRIAIDTLPPLSMGALRFLVAGGLMYGWGIRGAARPAWREWRAAILVGAGLFLGGNGGVVLAQRTIPSSVAALIVALTPLWMALLSRFALGEPLSRRTMIGLPIGFAGLVLLVGPTGPGAIDPRGGLLCAAATLSWAAASLYLRRAPLPPRASVSTGMQMLAGGAWLLVAGVVAGEPATVDFGRVSAASVGALAYLVVAGSLAAFSAYAWLLRVAPVSIVATYAYVNPIVAVALGYALLGEPFTLRMAGAGALIVLAVVLIASGGRRG